MAPELVVGERVAADEDFGDAVESEHAASCLLRTIADTVDVHVELEGEAARLRRVADVVEAIERDRRTLERQLDHAMTAVRALARMSQTGADGPPAPS